MNNTVAVVLAAGVGKRFWPFATDKSLFRFFDKPLITHTLTQLTQAGFTDAIVVTNAANDKTIRLLHVTGLTIRTVVQAAPTGMADALLSAQKLVGKRPMLVLNAEDVVDMSLTKELSSAIRLKEAFVVGRKVTSYFDGGYLKLSGEKLTGIVEKPGQGKTPSNYVNLVFHYFPDPSAFFALLASSKSAKDDVYETALNAFAGQGSVRMIPYDGLWFPIKYPWHVLPMMEYFLANRLVPSQGKHVEIHHNVSISGPVYLGDNVRIFENTKIVGPVFIGDGTIIGNNNIIRDSMLGAHSVTGFNTDITRSFIGNDCWFHTNYVGDSVIENDVSMGSGTVTANLRLDEGEIGSVISGQRQTTGRHKLGAMIGSHVRIGVNSSIMPGVKIGSNSMVGAGITLSADLPDASFCVATPNYTVVKNTKLLTSGARDVFKAKL
jgi:bifunctional UDP-N-acetylglucosamine pyrophosphorylase/glucosamine-1-phosphate N-acetyltransferase